jgi:hypothetical protein
MIGLLVESEIAMEVTVFPPGFSSQSQERLSRNSSHFDRHIFVIPAEGLSVCKMIKTLKKSSFKFVACESLFCMAFCLLGRLLASAD